MKHTGTNSTTLTLYRGQQMTKQSFERIKNNVGGLLSFNNFLSTTANKNLALIYAGNTFNNEDLTAVLFQMDIDIITNEFPFAKIDSISFFGEAEEEYLFTIGRLERETDWKEQVAIFQNLGLTCVKDGKQALTYFHQSLELIQKHIQDGYDSIYSSIYNNIGFVHQTMGDNNLALVYYEESLNHELSNHVLNKKKLFTRYNNIGMILLVQEEKDESKRYLQQALNTALEILPSMHPDLATSYSNLASCMNAMGRFVEAIDYQQKALDIDLHCLPPNHPQFRNHQTCLKSYQDSLEASITTVKMYLDRGAVGLILDDHTVV
ncbi:unnamed protein product [Rotaria sp. Silwood2]|nr:unnamed protein product [Rotaria sp. Silwood2]CAF4108839.1 unnamed protein product [Rotaria sp. Silwood2]